MKKLGKRTLGLGYAVALVRPRAVPLHPFQHGAQRRHHLPHHQEHPGPLRVDAEENPRKIGSYLMWTAIATTCVTSSMFMTSLAPNLLALSIVQKTRR